VNQIPCDNKSARKNTLEINGDVYHFSVNAIRTTVYVKHNTVQTYTKEITIFFSHAK